MVNLTDCIEAWLPTSKTSKWKVFRHSNHWLAHVSWIVGKTSSLGGLAQIRDSEVHFVGYETFSASDPDFFKKLEMFMLDSERRLAELANRVTA